MTTQSAGLRMPAISRALARHDPATAYTLIREHCEVGIAGKVLLALIGTVPDWPKPVHAESGQRLSQRELEVLRCADDGLSALFTRSGRRFAGAANSDCSTDGRSVS